MRNLIRGKIKDDVENVSILEILESLKDHYKRGDMVLRTYLIKAEKFKEYLPLSFTRKKFVKSIVAKDGEYQKAEFLFSNLYEFYLNMELPPLIWVTEISIPE